MIFKGFVLLENHYLVYLVNKVKIQNTKMRPRFEKDLRGYSEVAKDDPYEIGEKPDEADNLSVILDWHFEKAAERQHTNKDVQKEIYDLQKRKQEIMRRLKEQLACLDNPECQMEAEPGVRPAKYNSEENNFLYFDDKGDDRNATFGEIIADIGWGVYYDLDRSAPRAMQKTYLVECAKGKLREILDVQIIKSEVGGDIIDPVKKSTYEIVRADREAGRDKLSGGFIAEGVVKGMLKKISIDRKDLPFEVYEGDVFQDVEQKIDFIIHLKERRRGVDVEADDSTEDVGIQFTTDALAEERKKKQIEKSKQRLATDHERIQDIALVIFPIKQVKILKEKWVKRGRAAGGPSKLLNRVSAGKLFRGLLNGLLPQNEIEEAWQKIQSDFREVGQAE